MEQQRDNTVTLVKAIGIILMVVGHVVASDLVVRKAIFTFHMPLFFIMSGYCFKEKYLEDAKQFVVRKIKGIYVPFVVFSLVFLALHNVFCHWHLYEPTWLYGWKDYLWESSRIVTRMSHNEGLLGTFWFLKELFWGNIIFYATYKLIKLIGNSKLVNGDWRLGAEWVTAIGLFVLTEIALIFHLRIPYFTVTFLSTYAAFFIAVGYLWKKAEWKCDQWWIWVIGIASVLIEAIFADRVAMKYQTPLSLVYYAIPAILGTMVVYNVCRWLLKIEDRIMKIGVSGLTFIGEHTLSIMALHFLAFKLVTFGYIKFRNLPIELLQPLEVPDGLANTGGGILLCAFVGTSVPLIFVWLWIKIKAKMIPIIRQNMQK